MTIMQHQILALIALAAPSVFAAVAQSAEQPARSSQAEKKTGYAPVNGLKMYYEIRGEGKPGVYIHPFVSHCGLVSGLPKNR